MNSLETRNNIEISETRYELEGFNLDVTSWALEYRESLELNIFCKENSEELNSVFRGFLTKES